MPITPDSISTDTIRANADLLAASQYPLQGNIEGYKKLHNAFSLMEKASNSNRPVRIMHFGDSQIEADRITSFIREKLQQQFGGNGPGLLEMKPVTQKLTWQVDASDSWKRYTLFGKIDSTITHNLERSQEYTNYIFNNYYKDSLPVYVFLVLSDCEIKGPVAFIEYIYTNTKNAKKYEGGKQLCEVLSVPPSHYYKNDTSNYSKLLNNILPIYINPGETYMTIDYWPYAATSAKDPIVKYDKVEIIKDQKVVCSFSHDSFEKYFKKTNVFGSRNSYMLTIKD